LSSPSREFRKNNQSRTRTGTAAIHACNPRTRGTGTIHPVIRHELETRVALKIGKTSRHMTDERISSAAKRVSLASGARSMKYQESITGKNRPYCKRSPANDILERSGVSRAAQPLAVGGWPLSIIICEIRRCAASPAITGHTIKAWGWVYDGRLIYLRPRQEPRRVCGLRSHCGETQKKSSVAKGFITSPLSTWSVLCSAAGTPHTTNGETKKICASDDSNRCLAHLLHARASASRVGA